MGKPEKDKEQREKNKGRSREEAKASDDHARRTTDKPGSPGERSRSDERRRKLSRRDSHGESRDDTGEEDNSVASNITRILEGINDLKQSREADAKRIDMLEEKFEEKEKKDKKDKEDLEKKLAAERRKEKEDHDKREKERDRVLAEKLDNAVKVLEEWRQGVTTQLADRPAAGSASGSGGSYAQAVRAGGVGVGGGGGGGAGGGISQFQLNSLVIAGFAPGTLAKDRMDEAERIMIKLDTSKVHFKKPVSEYLRSCVIRVPLKDGAPRAAIQMAVDEFRTCGYAPTREHIDKETKVKEDKPLYLTSPQSPARRRRNKTLRRVQGWFRKTHPEVTADICFGSGRIEDENGFALVKIDMGCHPTYYKLLRDKNISNDDLHKVVTTNDARPFEQEEY